MMELLAAIEGSAFSTWVKEANTLWAYPAILTLHTVGLALLVGANWVLDLRLLGFASGVPLTLMTKSFRIMWIGFWLNAVSGAMLFAGDATTKGATVLFAAKLGMVAVGVILIVLTKRAVYGRGDAQPSSGPAARALAVASLVVWVAAIAAGRLMAYI
jgi:hypothetical protein